MAADREPRCFDAFPYAERQNQQLWRRGREMPGWYPSLTQIFPMMVCRVLPVAGLARPAAYVRVLGHAAGKGRPAVWMGGYQASLLMDQTGWPVFRVERIFIPPEPALPLTDLLSRLLEDGKEIASGMGVRSFQVSCLETDGNELPGFPAVCSLMGPLVDSRLAGPLAELGFRPLTELGYYRTPAGGGGPAVGRRFRWDEADQARYVRLWTAHCQRHREDLLYVVSRMYALDPHLQYKMDPGERLERIRFLGDREQPAGLVSWYPDAYPQLLAGEATGPQVRLKLGELDPGAVTRAKVLKCLAPGAGEGEEELLDAALGWAASAAAAAHPNLRTLEVGPVALSHRALLSALERGGFERFGRLAVLERQLSRFRT